MNSDLFLIIVWSFVVGMGVTVAVLYFGIWQDTPFSLKPERLHAVPGMQVELQEDGAIAVTYDARVYSMRAAYAECATDMTIRVEPRNA